MTTPDPSPPYALRPAAQDAVTLLKADHALLGQLFAEYQQASSVANKQTLVADICVALSVHTQIEEEIFYPAMQSAMNDQGLIAEAWVGLADVKGLIAELEDIEPDGERYDAKVRLLRDQMQHLLDVERRELFPKARASSLDMAALGARMDARIQALLAQAV